MSPIIFGRFDTVARAEDAARALYARGFSVWDVSVISVAQQGGQGGRQPCVVLAACVRRGNATVAADVLREAGAQDLERTQGQWESGRWTDFDPAVHGGRQDAAQPLAREAVDCESTGNEDPGSELEHYVDRQRASRD
ncbi:hypothetical protein LMG23992_00804 [Cupriavidus laharis]|uniref:SPOR domain-containing protein n=1 Tax=Cupriavidus laharis TaxID=151654 RepID=A0ABM8WJF7_9BURK|nr:hypothetical protein [Cupriavidus laharis]CAG9167416.1 hypothetical protein LMG23992_00804 [Cupriavidus laharis]